MLDYMLEEPVECFKTSVWNKDWLMKEFEECVVRPTINASWAIDELEAGVPMSALLDNLWEGYEKWAEEYLDNEQTSFYEGCDEGY